MIAIIGVHGVGTQQKGRLFASLSRAVARSGYQSVPEEVFWSDETDLDNDHDAFLFGDPKRLFYSIGAVASEGFMLSVDRKCLQSPTQVAAQTFDIVAFGLFIVFVLLFPITLGLESFNAWFAARASGSATFLHPSRVLEALLFAATLVSSCAALVSGVAVQYLINAHRRPSVFTVMGIALKLALRRLIFFVAHAVLSPPIWTLSHFWPRIILAFLILLSVSFAVLIYPIHWYVLPLFFPKEILARDPLTISPLKILFGTGLGLLGFLFLILAFYIFKPVAKVLADLTFYIGDASHRRSLLHHLDSKLQPNGPFAGHLVLVGHSLGSVIAVDYLRSNVEALRHAKSVTLITMGSPLRRLMHRFFPASYPEPVELLSALSGCLQNFFWLNVYRPLDPIGGALFARTHAAGKDCCTRQIFRDKLLRGNIFAQHTRYFDDRLVQDICFAELKWPRASIAPSVPSGREDQFLSGRTYVPQGRGFRRTTAIIAAVTGVSILSWLVFHQWPRSVVGLTQERIAAFDRNSDVATGTLEVGQVANLWIFGHPYWPDYVAKGMFVPKGWTGELRVAPLDIDAREAFRWASQGEVKGYKLLNLAVRSDVTFRYNRNNPKEAVVEQFRSGRWLDRNGNWFNRAFVFLALVAMFLSLVHAQSGAAYRPARRAGGAPNDASASWD
ncbi:lipase family protein [Mesorhizobium sp. B2-8-9]|uniref:lipase family protein n=1 Tax=Mesorhizobium sp. B2-8-9 TaxID=2589899 RepID=UPI00112DC84C|nr:lipase family protein [Mesorhizobium sp. B2-8-9]TPI78498.1 lipase family protein [Mesorhizobium sp. B2-8-9]